MKWALVLLLALSPALRAEESDAEIAKSLRWKATLFAATALIAVVAGIVVISLDGGTSNSVMKQQRAQKEKACEQEHCQHRQPNPCKNPYYFPCPNPYCQQDEIR